MRAYNVDEIDTKNRLLGKILLRFCEFCVKIFLSFFDLILELKLHSGVNSSKLCFSLFSDFGL